MNPLLSSFAHSFLVYAVAILLLFGCASTPPSQRIDNVPMYGQPGILRPDFLRQADEQFIREATAGFGERGKASDIWWAQGEEFFAQNNMDFAMRRYNQSWLLNPSNFKAYWGFARVLLERNDIEAALMNLETAISLCKDNFQRPALLTDAGSAYSKKADRLALDARRDLFRKADSFFEQALKVDPNYGNAYKRWAMSLHRQERYLESWAKVEEARKHPDVIFPSAFLKSLESKLPEAK